MNGRSPDNRQQSVGVWPVALVAFAVLRAGVIGRRFQEMWKAAVLL